LKGSGYTAQDYQTICEVVAGRDFSEFFSHFVSKASTLESLLAETVSLAGLMVESTPSPLAQENLYGIRTEQRNGNTFITSVYPGSPAHIAGLLKDDEILSVNNIRVENNLHDLCDLAKGKDSLWQIASSKKVRSANLVSGEKQFWKKYKITPSEQMTAAQLKFREGWIAK
jgi:predicted metalloprotease with PDZ domain